MEPPNDQRENAFQNSNLKPKFKKRSKSHLDEQYVQESTFNKDLNAFDQKTKKEIIKKYTNPDKKTLLELSEDVTKTNIL